MVGVLLDTHVLYWLVSGEKALTEEALIAIGENQEADALYVSPISAWELAIAAQKPVVAGRPHLGDDPPARWFREAVAVTGAKLIPIKQRIALEAAAVVMATGHKDPGDCYLIASARVRKIPLITRDGVILAIAAGDADYLATIGA